MTLSTPDEVARAALSLYETLPRHGKPTVRANGLREWTVLATMSLVLPSSRRVIPVSLGTGVKVLSATKLPPLGDAVHDSHAEILARRGFVAWLLDQAKKAIQGGESMLLWDGAKFRLEPSVEVWLYVSTLPCGDASTLHTAAHQDPSKSSPCAPYVPLPGAIVHAVRGRRGYENYGAIRTKPGRADCEPTISLSCSDKIATWSALGLQGALLEDVFAPVYLTGIVMGGIDTKAPAGYDQRDGEPWEVVMHNEIERALWGRLKDVRGRLPAPYDLCPPSIHFTSVPFHHHRKVVAENSPIPPVSAMLSILHIPSIYPTRDIIFSGTKQGYAWKAPGATIIQPKGRLRITKYELFRSYLGLRDKIEVLTQGELRAPERGITYYDLKHQPGSAYQKAKAILRGKPVLADSLHEAFGAIGPFEVTGGCCDAGVEAEDDFVPPFTGWIVSGDRFETFNRAGELVFDSDSAGSDSDQPAEPVESE